MKRQPKVDFLYAAIAGKHPHFMVTGRSVDGTTRVLGRVEYKWYRHLRQFGWEATSVDGSHRAVHEHQWQAAWALNWDGKGYPFPVIAAH